MSQPSPLVGPLQHARVLRDAGDLTSARRVLTDAVEAGRPALGEDHPELLGAQHILARLHIEADEPTAARRVLEQAYAAGERRFGEADPLMLAISHDLGAVAEELGNRHEARRAYGRVATHGPAVLGDDHWTVRAAATYLGVETGTAHPGIPQSTQPPSPPPANPVDHGPVVHGSAPYQQPVHDQRTQAPPESAVTAAVVHLQRPQPPAAPQWPAAPAAPARPLVVPGAGERSSRGRGATVAAIVAAGAAVVAAALVAVLVLRGGDDPAPPETDPTVAVGEPGAVVPSGPMLDGEPPTELKLRDSGDSITVTWEDPTAGTVPFIVAAGRSGQQLRAMATIQPGETRYVANGLNDRVDYCFTVVAVYAADRYATSGQVCTRRDGSSPG